MSPNNLLGIGTKRHRQPSRGRRTSGPLDDMGFAVDPELIWHRQEHRVGLGNGLVSSKLVGGVAAAGPSWILPSRLPPCSARQHPRRTAAPWRYPSADGDPGKSRALLKGGVAAQDCLALTVAVAETHTTPSLPAPRRKPDARGLCPDGLCFNYRSIKNYYDSSSRSALMPDFSSVAIPAPKNWQTFEKHARLLFEHSFNDPQTQNNGRTGQPQHGVDIFGRRNGHGNYVGVQCKGKDVDYGGGVTTAELRSEVEKSEAFRPAIGEFILITTAPDDAEIQKAARELENETRARGRPLTIAVWGWGRMQLEIVRYPAVLKAFHPDASPFTDLLIEQGEQIKHLVKQQLVEQRRAAERLAAIENTLLQAPISTVDLSATEFALDRHINEEIDTYRDLINAGRPRTAIHLLGGLAERLGAGTSSKIRFRIIANIGVAHHRLSEFSEAAIRFTDAYELDPDDQNSIANKIAALLIQSRSQEAHSLAEKAIERFPENPNIALQRLQALGPDESFESVWVSLPASVTGKVPLRIRRILWLHGNQDSSWRDILSNALTAEPDNRQLRLLRAHDILARVVSIDESALGVYAADSPSRSELIFGATEFEELWTYSISTELEPDFASAHNGALAFMIAGDLDASATLLDAALGRGSSVEESKKLRMSIFLRRSQIEDAIKLADTLAPTPHNAIFAADALVKINTIAARESLAARSEYLDRRDIVAAAQIYIDSYLRDENYEAAMAEADRLQNILPDDPLSALAMFQISSAQGQVDASRHLDEAAHRLRPDSDYPTRFFVVQALGYAGRFDDVVDLLQGRVTTARDSPALREFIAAAANADRRTTLNRVLDEIPDEILDIPFYRRARIALAIRLGNIPRVEQEVRAYLQLRPRSVEAHLQFLQVLARQEKLEEVRAEVAKPASDFEGPPEEFLNLAQFKDAYGDWQDAHQLAYRTWLENQNNPLVNARYVGVFLRPGHSKELDVSPSSVSENMSVGLKHADVPTVEVFTIEPDAILRPAPRFISPQHRVAQLLLNKRVGDEFELPDGTKTKIEWIKPKQLHALHEIMENFQKLFPQSGGLERVEINAEQPGGLKPIVDRVRARQEAIEQAFNQYSSGQMPISVLARSLGSSSVDAFIGLLQSNKTVLVCDGTHQERAAAFAAIDANGERGCIVDAITLQIIWSLDLADAVSSICGPMGIVEQTQSRVFAKIKELEESLDGPDMSLFFKDGQVLREEISVDRKRQHLEKLQQQRDWIATHTQIIPAQGRRDLSPDFRGLTNTFGQDLADDLLAAQGTDRLFVSEDRMMRLLAVTEFGVAASWLQPILMRATEVGKLSRDEYSNATLSFVRSGFSFISIDSQLLLWSLHSTRDVPLPDDFIRCASRLGGLTADLESHIRVALGTIAATWHDHLLSLTLRMAIVGKLLENLANGRSLEQLAYVVGRFRSANGQRNFVEYLSSWLSGHFF
jgi:tetratricopeptide (TPR) repeat protein